MRISTASRKQKKNAKRPLFLVFSVVTLFSMVAVALPRPSTALTQRIAFGACPDLTGDGNVNGSDLSSLASGKASASYDAKFDLNGDGKVDDQDISVLVGFFGQTGVNCSPTAAWELPLACPDLNRDHNVDGSDVSYLASAMPPKDFDPAFDLNGDGKIDKQDGSVLEGYLGRTDFTCPVVVLDADPQPALLVIGPACPDITNDHNVDGSDLSALSALMSPAAFDHRGDLNDDGAVNQSDVSILRGYFGQTNFYCATDGDRIVWTPPCPDLNGGGNVDGSDVSYIATGMGISPINQLFDLNRDGAVSQQDVDILSGYIGQSGFSCNRPQTPSQTATTTTSVAETPAPTTTVSSQPAVKSADPVVAAIPSTMIKEPSVIGGAAPAKRPTQAKTETIATVQPSAQTTPTNLKRQGKTAPVITAEMSSPTFAEPVHPVATAPVKGVDTPTGIATFGSLGLFGAGLFLRRKQS